MSSDLIWSCDQRFFYQYGWVSLILSHHPAKFGEHRHCRRGDILIFKWEHVVRRLYDIISGFYYYKSRSCQIWLRGQRVKWHYGWVLPNINDYPANFGDQKFFKKDFKLSICLLHSRHYVIRGSCYIVGEFPSS